MTGNDKIDYASLTDVGVRRSHNQDAHAVLLAGDDEQWRKQGHIFLVADGMGAHAVGELASELASNIIPLSYSKHAEEGPDQALQKSIVEANTDIHARGQQNREFQGMGTTCTVLVIRPEGAWVGHVGDSRAYRVRDGQIEQLSFDHSLLWEMARRKKVTPDQVQGVPTNVIIRSLGPDGRVDADVEGPHPLRKGDVFLLCSDGLSGQVADHEIGTIAGQLPPAEACQFLIDLANLRGGPDNITVIIVRVGFNTDASAELSATPKPLWLRIPWPLGALLLGVLAAIWAVVLTAGKEKEGVLYFVLGVVFILVGLAGLVANFVWEQRHASVRSPRRARTKTYTQTPCQVDRTFLDRLAKAETEIEQMIREKQWEANWEEYAQHQQQAQRFLTDGDLPGAFREYCRAMRPLTLVLHKNRHKEEVFQPNWDKKK